MFLLALTAWLSITFFLSAILIKQLFPDFNDWDHFVISTTTWSGTNIMALLLALAINYVLRNEGIIPVWVL